MRICICDDNTQETEDLKILIEKYYRQKNNCNLFFDCFFYATEFINSLKNKTYDLIFLDIFIKNENGFEIAKKIQDKNIPIILYSSSKDYAIEGYTINIFGYLTKPIKEESLFTIIDKYEKSKIPHLIQLKSNGKSEIINIKNILFIESRARKIYVHFSNNETKSYYYRLDEIEKMIDSKCFLRSHKSYLVNMKKIIKIEKNRFIVENEKSIQITQKNFNLISKKYIDFIIKRKSINDE